MKIKRVSDVGVHAEHLKSGEVFIVADRLDCVFMRFRPNTFNEKQGYIHCVELELGDECLMPCKTRVFPVHPTLEY